MPIPSNTAFMSISSQVVGHRKHFDLRHNCGGLRGHSECSVERADTKLEGNLNREAAGEFHCCFSVYLRRLRHTGNARQHSQLWNFVRFRLMLEGAGALREVSKWTLSGSAPKYTAETSQQTRPPTFGHGDLWQPVVRQAG